MNQSESKYFHTAIRMDEAFLSLLEKKDPAYITVKEICETAGVNRSTFYLHYENVGDLITETMDYVNRKFSGYFQTDYAETSRKLKDGAKEDLIFVTPEYLTPYLTFVKENRRLFMAALSRQNVYRTEEKFKELYELLFGPIFDRFDIPDEERGYIIYFYIHGIMGIICEWVKGDCGTDIGTVGRLITKLILKTE